MKHLIAQAETNHTVHERRAEALKSPEVQSYLIENGLLAQETISRAELAERFGTPPGREKRRYGAPSEKTRALARTKEAGALTFYDPKTGDPLEGRPAKPKPKPKHKSRLKGEWKAP